MTANNLKIDLGTPKIKLDSPQIDLGTPKINLDTSLLHAQMVVSSVQRLLSFGKIPDAADRKIVAAAMEYLRNPTKNFASLSGHISKLVEIWAYADAIGESLPPEVYQLLSQLVRLEVQQHNDRVNVLRREETDNHVEIMHTLVMAHDAATVLAKVYTDQSMLSEVARLGSDPLEQEVRRLAEINSKRIPKNPRPDGPQ